ncbi:hypothetical protein MPSEU_001036900 [Mayamaea pseudoterrestris]|nr:hypothetical protein MPSEU_001036900 [Mayamaea pseudoterrestris]
MKPPTCNAIPPGFRRRPPTTRPTTLLQQLSIQPRLDVLLLRRTSRLLTRAVCIPSNIITADRSKWKDLHTKYFHEPSNPMYASTTWFRVHIGYDMPTSSQYYDPHVLAAKIYKHFAADVAQDMRVEYKISADVLQTEYTVKVGYFQNFPVDLDFDLARANKETSEHIGIPVNIFQANLGFVAESDKKLILSARQKTKGSKYEAIRAYHIEVESHDARTATDKLLAKFPNSIEPGVIYPAGLRASIVPIQAAEVSTEPMRRGLCELHRSSLLQFQRTDIMHGVEDITRPLLQGRDFFTLQRIFEDIAADDPVATGRLYLFEQVNQISPKQVRGVFHVSNLEKIEATVPYLYALVRQFAPMLLRRFNLTEEDTADFYTRLQECFSQSYIDSKERVVFDEDRGVFTSPDDTAIAAIYAAYGLAGGEQDEDQSIGGRSGHDISRLNLGTRMEIPIARARNQFSSGGSTTSSVTCMTDQSLGMLSTTSAATKLRLAQAESENRRLKEMNDELQASHRTHENQMAEMLQRMYALESRITEPPTGQDHTTEGSTPTNTDAAAAPAMLQTPLQDHQSPMELTETEWIRRDNLSRVALEPDEFNLDDDDADDPMMDRKRRAVESPAASSNAPPRRSCLKRHAGEAASAAPSATMETETLQSPQIPMQQPTPPSRLSSHRSLTTDPGRRLYEKAQATERARLSAKERAQERELLTTGAAPNTFAARRSGGPPTISAQAHSTTQTIDITTNDSSDSSTASNDSAASLHSASAGPRSKGPAQGR